MQTEGQKQRLLLLPYGRGIIILHCFSQKEIPHNLQQDVSSHGPRVN